MSTTVPITHPGIKRTGQTAIAGICDPAGSVQYLPSHITFLLTYSVLIFCSLTVLGCAPTICISVRCFHAYEGRDVIRKTPCAERADHSTFTLATFTFHQIVGKQHDDRCDHFEGPHQDARSINTAAWTYHLLSKVSCVTLKTFAILTLLNFVIQNYTSI